MGKNLAKLVMAWAIITTVLACDTTNSELAARSGRLRLAATLVSYSACASLESDLKAHFKDELRNRLAAMKDQHGYGRIALDSAESTTGGAPANAAKVEGVDYSGTNVQEGGVDESDFVKTDGNYIYILNGNKLEILGVPTEGNLKYLSNIDVEGSPTQMLLFGDRLAIFSFASQGYGKIGAPQPVDLIYFAPNRTKITIVDLGSDRTAPKVQKEIFFDGQFLTGRKIGSKIFMISHYSPQIKDVVEYPPLNLPENFNYENQSALQAAWEDAIVKAIAANNAALDAATLDDLVPHFYNLNNKTLEPISLSDADCSNFSRAEDSVARSFSSVLTLDLAASDVAVEADHILSNFPQVYASQTTLILAEPTEDSWWFYGNPDIEEATNLHRFAISTTGETSYTGSGRVDGTVLNQFSLSENNGFIRVVTTSGRFNRWFLPPNQQDVSENHLYVLSGADELNVTGRIDGIAKGERIWSSRFVGDKGYLVTFKNIDPLFTIDLADPSNPRIVAELKVPGVSTYIHPLDGYLLNVGYGGNNEGLDWSTNLSLFDVTDFANPKQQAVLDFSPTSGNQSDGWMGASSEANYEHKAITYWAPERLLAIPVSTYRSTSRNWEYVSRLMLVRVNVPNQLELYGTIDHSTFYNDGGNNFYNPEIRRSIFIGPYIYAISQKGVTANQIANIETQTSRVRLKGGNYPIAIGLATEANQSIRK